MNTRRQFLKQAGAASAVLSTLRTPFLGQEAARPAASKKPVRVRFVGVGLKGSSHVGNLLRLEGVELRAVCDIVDLQCRETQAQARRLGLRPPAIYSRGERDFERMCTREESDRHAGDQLHRAVRRTGVFQPGADRRRSRATLRAAGWRHDTAPMTGLTSPLAFEERMAQDSRHSMTTR